METSWSARVVPMGSAMIGTVSLRASTTDTTGGGGTRSASTRDEQPAIVTEAQVIPSTSPTWVPGLVSLRSNMIALLHKRAGVKCAALRPRLNLRVQVRQCPLRHGPRRYGSEWLVGTFLSKVTVTG